MTEKEAIELLKKSYIVDFAGDTDQHRMNLEKFLVSILEEIQQYREIGTVEECHAAVEKRIQKRALRRKCGKCDKDCDGICEDYADRCPECKKTIYNEYGVKYAYCPNCGQAIDWSGEE